jgi:hypothetical protein
MIKIEEVEIFGWRAAIRGMRNSFESWDKSDTVINYAEGKGTVGDEDGNLMRRLSSAGSSHAKFRRMIHVQFDLTAPLYFWKEFDTYKVGTVANSCSTMHTIADREFSRGDFSVEHLYSDELLFFDEIIERLNAARQLYLDFNKKNKSDWWQMIQLLPSSYNQKRTIDLNYEALASMYKDRRHHKLDEWQDFCDWIETLPLAEGVIYRGGAACE